MDNKGTDDEEDRGIDEEDRGINEEDKGIGC